MPRNMLINRTDVHAALDELREHIREISPNEASTLLPDNHTAHVTQERTYWVPQLPPMDQGLISRYVYRTVLLNGMVRYTTTKPPQINLVDGCVEEE